MPSQQMWNVAVARLDALRKNIPPWIDEAVVNDYNALVHSLQVASSDENIVHFRISRDALKPKVLSARRGTRRSPGQVTHSSKLYCNEHHFKAQVEGLWNYLQKLESQHQGARMSKDYWAMTEEELEKVAMKLKIPYADVSPDGTWRIDRRVIIDEALKRDRALREENPVLSNVINVSGGLHGSSIQQGSAGSAATINYKAMESDVRTVLANIRKTIDQLKLSSDVEKELMADMGTVESQLDSSNPKTSIITECLHSMRVILEHAAGAAIGHGVATGLAFEVARLLAHR